MATRVRATCWRPSSRSSLLSSRVRAQARVVRGPAYVVQDNIDTDQIIPAEYLTLVPTKVQRTVEEGEMGRRGELYPYETPVRLCEEIKTGETVELDMDNDELRVPDKGKVYKLLPLGDAGPVIDAGGLFKYARQTGMIAKS
eukprot:jgi/Pico_ML_1/54932/g69.t1